MEFIADLHIHSYLSRATAKNLNLEHLNLWAQLKGIAVVGTGDFTHPQWFSELSEKLEPAEEGLFALKPAYAAQTSPLVPASCAAPVRFVLSVEISSIYKKDGKTRKVHNVILLPSFAAAKRLNQRLERIGNIGSDGRPILGLDAKALLAIVLEIADEAIFIPAHIWTPWFSVLGSKSGFDSLGACFEDLTDEIFAVETGLSSDPAMNRRVSSLDRFALVSNSDAHSPANLGREANLFDTELSYGAMREALKTKNPDRFLGTLEYFAEEGKYHLDGHRKCGVRLTPEETLGHQGLCPVCKRPVTIGVMYRVEELADRPLGERPVGAPGYTSLLPLADVLSEVFQTGPKSKKVDLVLRSLLEKVGPEFEILRHAPADVLRRHGPALFSEAIVRMREGRVQIAPGYDGEFGKVCLFSDQERFALMGQENLFAVCDDRQGVKTERPLSLFGQGRRAEPREGDQPGRTGEGTQRQTDHGSRQLQPEVASGCGTQSAAQSLRGGLGRPTAESLLADLNPTQQQAVRTVGGPLLIVAGPGTGKTRTLTHRIAYLLSTGIALPEQVLAVTFTNKAALEMTRRLATLVGDREAMSGLTIRTFHGLCLDILSGEANVLGIEVPIRVLGEADRMDVVRKAMQRVTGKKQGAERVSSALSLLKQRLLTDRDDLAHVVPHESLAVFPDIYRSYQDVLSRNALFDFDDLIFRVVGLFEAEESIRKKYTERFAFISVDEYQDINRAQYRLIRLLAPPPHDLCVIGDPDQAIYGFRGADVQYFRRFFDDYPGAGSIVLNRNYRSTETILRASGQVMPGKEGGSAKGRIWSGIDGIKTLTIAELPTEKAEAEHIVETIESQVGGISHFSLDSGRADGLSGGPERSFGDFAVLYRTREQAKALQEAFARAGIPYQGQGSQRLEMQNGIRELLSYLKVIWDCAWDLDVERLLTFPPAGLGRAVARYVKARAERTGQTLLDAFADHDDLAGPDGSDASVAARIVDFTEKTKSIRGHFKGKDVSLQIQIVLDDLGLGGGISGRDPLERHVETLLETARPFGRDHNQFLNRLAMEREQDRCESGVEKVALMTMHAAKGLEFSVVFIAGCEDGLIPYKRPGEEGDILEEGRLFYVALTRAREKVFLTCAKKRKRFGKTICHPVSPFVKAIEDGLKEHVRFCRATPRPKAPSQLTLF